MTRIIDEVKALTAEQVAKKQDAAKLNFPKIVDQIRKQAAKGESQCYITLHEMNEFDKKLLEQEGFKVYLEEKPYKFDKLDYLPKRELLKFWKIMW